MSISNIIVISIDLFDYFSIHLKGGKMVADRIKKLREQKDITQSELAK